MIFKRKIYNRLLEFKKQRGKYSLLVEGARRIGKTTTLREFAKNEYESFIFVDFQADKRKATEAFDELPDLDSFFRVLMLNYNTLLVKEKSLIVFDEVQFFPKAREALKQLVADGRYDFIATGSLLSIKSNVKDILIPSEEERISMYPMDFEEFCLATDNELLYSYIRQCFEDKKPLLETQHQKAMKLFRTYLAVGGMPQAVNDYVEGRSFQEIDKTKRMILQLYKDDLKKLDTLYKYRCDAVLRLLPNELESHSRIFRTSRIFQTDSARRVNTFNAIEDSKIVNVCRFLEQPSIDFNQYAEESKFKLYLADTGLLTTMIYQDSEAPLEDGIYHRLIADKLSTNDGMLYENVVAQAFKSQGRQLYYHAFQDENKHRYELDFLLRRGKKIVPVEVKSSRNIQHTSLDKSMIKYSSIFINPIILSSKNYTKYGIYNYFPLYMTSLIAEKL